MAVSFYAVIIFTAGKETSCALCFYLFMYLTHKHQVLNRGPCCCLTPGSGWCLRIWGPALLSAPVAALLFPTSCLRCGFFFSPIPRLGSNSACYISMTTFVLPALATWSSTWALPPPPWPEELTALRHRLIFFCAEAAFWNKRGQSYEVSTAQTLQWSRFAGCRFTAQLLCSLLSLAVFDSSLGQQHSPG